MEALFSDTEFALILDNEHSKTCIMTVIPHPLDQSDF